MAASIPEHFAARAPMEDGRPFDFARVAQGPISIAQALGKRWAFDQLHDGSPPPSWPSLESTAERNVASAEAYYEAMRNKDIAGIARHLNTDVGFIGPMAELLGKEAVLEAAGRFSGLIKNLGIRAKFGSEDHAMLAYDVDFGEPIGICRTAVLITFREGLIAGIELFYDARPFEKNLKKDAIFSSR